MSVSLNRLHSHLKAQPRIASPFSWLSTPIFSPVFMFHRMVRPSMEDEAKTPPYVTRLRDNVQEWVSNRPFT